MLGELISMITVQIPRINKYLEPQVRPGEIAELPGRADLDCFYIYCANVHGLLAAVS